MPHTETEQEIVDLLEERQKIHGDTEANMECIGSLWNVWAKYGSGGEDFTAYDTAVMMLLSKIGRIACGDRAHQDHYDDIKGYAEIARKMSARS
tara:strand:- start:607 stop:888 length:282 start_codon:yes stop_codon:yes gene_type:complete